MFRTHPDAPRVLITNSNLVGRWATWKHFHELDRRGAHPDLVTDQTSAHDPLHGHLPAGWDVATWEERQRTDPEGVERAAKESMAVHVRAILDLEAVSTSIEG